MVIILYAAQSIATQLLSVSQYKSGDRDSISSSI